MSREVKNLLPSTSLNQDQELETNYANQPSVRNILGFLDKYDRLEQQELLSQTTCHYLLSLEDFRLPIEYPAGLITQMPPLNDDHVLVLVPYVADVQPLDYREIHQIIRELTIGMYVLNQHPSLQLEANIDQSTSCQLPPAYIDTKLGQIMVNTDYWLKALWHGSYINREKRIKFLERWRQVLDIDSNGIAQTKKPIFQEFVTNGLNDIAKDHDYAKIFDKSDLINNGNGQHSISFGVGMSASFIKKTRSSSIEFAQQLVMTKEQVHEEMTHFMNYIDDISLQMTFGLKTVKQYKNLYEYSPEFDINITCKADDNRIDDKIYERLKRIMNAHEKYVRDHFQLKEEIRRNVAILNLVGFLIPLFVGLKKRMKIPDLNNLLPTLAGDEVHTERELPPLMIGEDFKSNTFSAGNFNKLYEADKHNSNPYFSLHGGIQFELETSHLGEYSEEEFHNNYELISKSCKEVLNSYVKSEQQLQEYRIPVIEINNKKYWAIRIDFESFYAQFPYKPYWVNKLNDDLSKLRPKRLPMTDIQVYDLYKKLYGFKKATKLKNIQSGLKASAQRGCIGVFQSFSRKTPISNLARHDDSGLGLVHYAAIFNRHAIVANLCMLGVDSNLRQQIKYAAIGAMPVHYAARCGSLDVLSCILANYGNISNYDEKGWAPIHHAAFFDNVPCIRLFCRRQIELLEIQTKNESVGRKTPLLVAASSGALEATKCLIELGANLAFQDEYGNNCIHVAAHRTHTNILEHFISSSYPQLPTWKYLISMLADGKEDDMEASVRCIQLLTYSNKKYWRSVLEFDGLEKMSNILKKFSSGLLLLNEKTSKLQASLANLANQSDNEEAISQTEMIEMQRQQMHEIRESITPKKQCDIALNTLSALCNLCDQYEIKKSLSEIKDLSDTLMKILRYSQNEDMESRVAILISDIVSADENYKVLFEERGCLDFLMKLLDRDTEDLLVNTVNALEIMCKNNIKNQDYCCEKGVLASLINLLYLNSDFLKVSVSAAISAITHNNKKNQQTALQQGVIKSLVSLLKSRNMTVQLKVALALESLAINNTETQQAILSYDAATYMIKLVERMYYVGATIKSNMEDWSIIVREQAAITLWTLAGIQKPQRRAIAEKIGSSQIMSMLMSKSEKLQYVGCKCMIALVLENVTYQNLILKENGTDPLIRLLRMEKTSSRVILAILETLAALCVDIAHVNNLRTQTDLSEKGAIDLVMNILNNPPSKYIQIETAYALACLILNRPNIEAVKGKLNIQLILDLINTDDLELRLRAGLAITVLAFNNNDKQFDIKACGGISYENYRVYFEDPNVDVMHLCKACFQIVVLARVINDRDQVWLTALGIGRLVQLLLLEDDDVVIQTASFMSSLAHTRPGITDAMITCDAVDILCDRIYSTNDQIRFASAVTLGYLTYNRTASRLLLHNCRNVTKLYDTLRSILRPENKISDQFIESYETALKLGLPKMLVKNKVSFYDPNNKKDYTEEEIPKFFRPVEHEEIVDKKTQKNLNRSQSAPINKQKLSLTDIENVNTDSGIINEVEEENDVKRGSISKPIKSTKSKIVRPVTYAQSNRNKSNRGHKL